MTASPSAVVPAGRPWQELLPALEWLDSLLERATARARAAYAPAMAGEQFRGLYVSEEDIDNLLARRPGEPLLFSPERQKPIAPRLARLGHTFSLSPFDLDVALLALAPELDRRYEQLYAYLQDNVNLRRPTVDLALHLFCGSAAERLDKRSRFAGRGPLIEEGLVRLIAENEHATLLAATLKLDEQVTAFLLGEDGDGRLDGRLAAHGRLVPPGGSSPPGYAKEVVERLASTCHAALGRGEPARIQLPVNRDDAAGLLAAALGREVLELGLAGADTARVMPAFAIAARLRDVVPCILTADAVLDAAARAQVARFLSAWPGIAAVVGPSPGFGLELRAVELGDAGFEERRDCWERELAARDVVMAAEDLDDLSGRLRVSPAEIGQAVGQALWRAQWRAGTDEEPRVGPGDLYETACELSTAELATLARRLRPAARWDELVLPAEAIAQLREMCARVARRRLVLETWGFEQRLSLGRGTVALFAGPPGTGKTLAAETVAAELRLDLCKIDLSSVVSKYIGETEKNLARVFAAAERANAILFFDEADALFGKRSEVRDAHDRYANVEISYLLQRMEEYDGVAILATNLRQNLDDSFIRRIAFMVHFPFPDEASRLAIWERIWPLQTPLAPDIDAATLARDFKLAGGNIKNVALAAAFLAASEGAPVTMAHVRQATRRELQKLGKALPGIETAPLAAPALVVNGHA